MFTKIVQRLDSFKLLQINKKNLKQAIPKNLYQLKNGFNIVHKNAKVKVQSQKNNFVVSIDLFTLKLLIGGAHYYYQ